jgi:alkylation response protein AidB-like acyl-CoA dehydrogenase
VLNGEKWFVTSEGQPGVYVVAALADGEQQLFLVEPDAPGLRIVRTPSFLHDPYLDHHPELELNDCRVPEANRVRRRRRRRRQGVDSRRAVVHRRALLRRVAGCSTSRATGRRNGRPSALRSPTTRASPSRSLTR